MATATTLHFTTKPEVEFSISNLTEESAKKATEILQENHDKWDIIYTDGGFHNHIPHHICTSFALGGTPDALQRNYERNLARQRPPPPLDEQLLGDLYDPKVFVAKMGTKVSYYSAYLKLFKDEMAKKGWEQVVQEYILKGDERANVMFKRMFAGYMHPMIHFGFGLEFGQPAIMAEGMGQACIHTKFIDVFFDGVDEYIKKYNPKPKTLKEVFWDIQHDEKLKASVKWEDAHKIHDGVLMRGAEEMISQGAKYRVDPDNLEEAAAEMINACAYLGAAQRPDKAINFDFYFMHAINASILYPRLIKLGWISKENKAKLLEHKGRIDTALYASRRAPPLHLDQITSYKPKYEGSDWAAVFRRASAFGDDGHACKYIRALASGERVCKPYEHREDFMIKGPVWLQLANAVMDSVERTDATWIRHAGFEEAWAEEPDRSEVEA